MSAIRFEAACEQFARRPEGSARRRVLAEMMPPLIEATGRWLRPGTAPASARWAMGALCAVRGTVSTLVIRAAPVPPAPRLSKGFQHSPEWRKFLWF